MRAQNEGKLMILESVLLLTISESVTHAIHDNV